MNADTTPRRREVTFLPPLSMPLTFGNWSVPPRRSTETPEERKETTEKAIVKLIEKLSEKEK